MVAPATVCATGRIVGLLENALYGGVPPVTVSVVGVPGNMSITDGKTTSGPGGIDAGGGGA